MPKRDAGRSAPCAGSRTAPLVPPCHAIDAPPNLREPDGRLSWMLPIGRRPRRDRTTVLDGTDFTAAEWKPGSYDMAHIEAGGREGDVRVLIVEDEPSLRQTVAEVVAQLGHEVIALGDAESAWRAYT